MNPGTQEPFQHFPWLIIREELEPFLQATHQPFGLSFSIFTKLTISNATTAKQRASAFPEGKNSCFQSPHRISKSKECLVIWDS